MAGIKFAEKIAINSCPEFVFDYTQNYGQRLTWDTFLKRAELLEGATTAGVGIKAYCVA
ncbi:MAG: hypothetical protein ACTHMM_05370 [Agriterribacter sp.]